MGFNFKKFTDEEIINLYPQLLNELKARGIIRTNNLVGELGEFHAKTIYEKDTTLPRLQLNLKSTKNIDATSSKGERYAIKTTSGSATGVFASLPNEDDGKVYFEYLILVIFHKDYSLKEVYELTWKDFLKFRRMKPPENKWNLRITNELKNNIKKIYPKT